MPTAAPVPSDSAYKNRTTNAHRKLRGSLIVMVTWRFMLLESGACIVRGQGIDPFRPAATISCLGPMKTRNDCLKTWPCQSNPTRCKSPVSSRRGPDAFCCCIEADAGEKECRTNPYINNGTSCERACCDNSWVPCGYGCCSNTNKCGFRLGSDRFEHNGNLSFECCLNPDIIDDLAKQEELGCCAWGSGIRCDKLPAQQPCCLNCPTQYRDNGAGMSWCTAGKFDETYQCQPDHTRCQAGGTNSGIMWVISAAAVFVVTVILIPIGLAMKRRPCCRRGAHPLFASERGISMMGDDGFSEFSQAATADMNHAQAEVVDDEQWFALLIAVDKVDTPAERASPGWFFGRVLSNPTRPPNVQQLYVDLERTQDDVERLERKLLEVQPKLYRKNIIKVPSHEATAANIQKAKDALIHKIAGTRNARAIVAFEGHGHENHLVARDGELVPIDEFFQSLRSGRGRQSFEKALQPQIIAILDCCRNPVPPGSPGAAAAPLQPSIPRQTDGSLYLIFATDPLASASDGGLTDAFLEALDHEGLNVVQVFEAMMKIRFQRPRMDIDGSQATSLIIHSKPRSSSVSSSAPSSSSRSRVGS